MFFKVLYDVDRYSYRHVHREKKKLEPRVSFRTGQRNIEFCPGWTARAMTEDAIGVRNVYKNFNVKCGLTGIKEFNVFRYFYRI